MATRCGELNCEGEEQPLLATGARREERKGTRQCSARAHRADVHPLGPQMALAE